MVFCSVGQHVKHFLRVKTRGSGGLEGSSSDSGNKNTQPWPPCPASQLLTLVRCNHELQHAEGVSLHCFRGPSVTVEGPLSELQGQVLP